MKKMVAAFVIGMVVLSIALLPSCKAKKPGKTAAVTGAEADKAPEGDPVRAKAISSLKKGIAFFKKTLAEDGAVELQKYKNLGMTALVMEAFTHLPAELKPEVKDLLPKMAAFVLKNQNKDGSFYAKGEESNANYQTAVAVLALTGYDREKYKAAIDRAVMYLLAIQVVDVNDICYGGWGYKKEGKKSTAEKKYLSADLSNTHFTLAALNRAGVDKNNPAFRRATRFLSRIQNRSESNDAGTMDATIKVGDDGGCIYGPGNSRSKNIKEIKTPDGKIRYEYASYAAMTYAGFKSMIYAHMKKDDPRVQAAYRWIQKHYTLEENYGMGTRKEPGNKYQGLYYFYRLFAKALQAYGEDTITTADGVKHDWRKEVIEKLATLQKEDGSWMNELQDRWYENIAAIATAYSMAAIDAAVEEMDNEVEGQKSKVKSQ